MRRRRPRTCQPRIHGHSGVVLLLHPGVHGHVRHSAHYHLLPLLCGQSLCPRHVCSPHCRWIVPWYTSRHRSRHTTLGDRPVWTRWMVVRGWVSSIVRTPRSRPLQGWRRSMIGVVRTLAGGVGPGPCGSVGGRSWGDVRLPGSVHVAVQLLLLHLSRPRVPR